MKYNHIYLSPHYDDAALSCGGSIHKQTKQQEPVAVITIFAGAPDLPNAALSKLAQAVHKEFTFLNPNPSPQDIVAARRQENEQAMLFLGADSICLEQFHDSIYRGIPGQNIFFY
ncbi:MAG: PIG-L family deacetylase [Candidatus Electrothrix sp. GW3-4]|uniref:PIG-L family deacetylase n=1 Tax=Candidatus Electrothrix sp. GW3-4 TaxID=3126740 RepID=UPI0030D030C2